MSKPIGPREQQLRDMRAQNSSAPKPTVHAIAAKLPPTTGKKPVRKKRKAKQ
jgi:hypothetical protein